MLDGRVTSSKLLLLANKLYPNVSMLSGNTIFFRYLLYEKAPSPAVFTLAGTVYDSLADAAG